MESNESKLIDISVNIKNNMVYWPDNTPVKIKQETIEYENRKVTLSSLSMSSHTGTHIDAPLHFIKNGKGIDKISLNTVVGPAKVIEIKDETSIKIDEIKDLNINKGDRILFKTKNSEKKWENMPFFKNYVYLSAKASEYLVEKQVQIIGIDYLSIGGFYEDGSKTHHSLLGAGIWVIEGLYLNNVKPGNYELICLPLKIKNGDGAPARVVLRK